MKQLFILILYLIYVYARITLIYPIIQILVLVLFGVVLYIYDKGSLGVQFNRPGLLVISIVTVFALFFWLPLALVQARVINGYTLIFYKQLGHIIYSPVLITIGFVIIGYHWAKIIFIEK